MGYARVQYASAPPNSLHLSTHPLALWSQRKSPEFNFSSDYSSFPSWFQNNLNDSSCHIFGMRVSDKVDATCTKNSAID